MLAVPGGWAHLVPSPEDIVEEPPQDPVESCGGRAPALTKCSTGQHVFAFAASHAVQLGPGYTGNVRSVLFPSPETALGPFPVAEVMIGPFTVGGFVVYPDPIATVSCWAYKGELLSQCAALDQSPDDLRGRPLGHECSSRHLDGPKLETAGFTSLAPGASALVNSTLWAPTGPDADQATNHFIVALADPLDEVAELGERNNLRRGAFQGPAGSVLDAGSGGPIAGTGKAELVVTDLTKVAAVPPPGFRFHATVKNFGDKPADSFRTLFLLDSEIQLGGAIKPGGQGLWLCEIDHR